MTAPEPRSNDNDSSESSPRPPQPGRKPERPPTNNLFWYLMIGLVLAALVFSFGSRNRRGETITAQVFLQKLEAGELSSHNVHELKFTPDRLTFQDKPLTAVNQPGNKTAAKTFTVWLLGLSDKTRSDIEAALQKASIPGWGGGPPETDWSPYISFIFLLALTLGVFLFVLRRIGGPGAAMSFGRSRGKMYAQEDLGVTFNDVAGIDEAVEELREIVEFLRTPGKYQALGGRIPHGVLLIGPPGTGKTLLAKAVAGEAGVPFFGLSGSDFVELFVGVGASRVRDLFAQAVQRAPSIIFIDELDAIGKRRGEGGPGNHDERDQTLNALLVEMDGFASDQSVIVMAATNRPETLDPALMRPGRFDRHVIVDRPDIKGREQILKVHAARIKMDDSVNLKYLAKLTPGFVGADLASLVNEAALLAARKNKTRVTMPDFEEGIERVIAGLEKQTRIISDEEKERVAYHEIGHALVACSLPHVDPVHKVSIIPRGMGALGYTLQRPEEDRMLVTRTELENRIAVMLGGIAAEDIVYQECSTGASNDLQRATDMARRMITEFGMSPKLGRVHYSEMKRSPFLTAGVQPVGEHVHSEETIREIDLEIKRLIDTGYATAHTVLNTRRQAMEHLTRDLLDKEVMDATQLRDVLDQYQTGPQLAPGTGVGIPPEANREIPPATDNVSVSG